MKTSLSKSIIQKECISDSKTSSSATAAKSILNATCIENSKAKNYTIKYAGIVDGKIGILSRKEPISPPSELLVVKRALNKRRIIRIKKANIASSGESPNRSSLDITAVVQPHSETAHFTKFESNTRIKNMDRENLDGTSPSGNKSSLLMSQCICSEDTSPNGIRSLRSKIAAFRGSFGNRQSLFVSRSETPDEAESGYPNPEKYNTPVVHTYAFGRQLFSSIKPLEMRRKVDRSRLVINQCREQRKGFAGRKVLLKSYLLKKRVPIMVNQVLRKEESKITRRWEIVQKEITEKIETRRQCKIKHSTIPGHSSVKAEHNRVHAAWITHGEFMKIY